MLQTKFNTVYGKYENQVLCGLISKEEAAYLAGVDYRKNTLINTLNMIKNSSDDEIIEAKKIIKQFGY